ncbi:MAG: hypothetical protein ACO1SX_25155 [Actinomycetota bacterium]
MKTDGTTKLLLGLIALALWVQIGRGLFTPIPAQAQKPAQEVDIVSVGGRRIVGELPVQGGLGRPVKVQSVN